MQKLIPEAEMSILGGKKMFTQKYRVSELCTPNSVTV